ncbi:AraC family transcriptional regulator [Dactylosporangium sp. CA-139066]|uniref:AraC family transcriptional regulator n=1 Tax=Dactylosporangium sp. CA-139066 TaxID=3239930 RepID=UPI003D92FFCB
MSASEEIDLRTRDRDAVVEVLNGIAAHEARVAFADPAEVDLHVRSGAAGGLGGVRLRLDGVGYAAANEPLDFILAGVVLAGRSAFREGARETRLTSGDGWIFPVGAAYSGEYGGTTLNMISVPVTVVAQLAEATSGVPAAELRFVSPRPVDEPMRRYWAGTAAYLARQLTEPGASQAPPLLAAQLEQLAASALLRVFPNTTMTAARTPDGGRVAPAALQRAVAFMDANPDRPLTVAEIAAAAGVGARGLQSAFRRHLGTSPLGYLRGMRLERVHRELQAADPHTGVTVRSVARRWGFANPSRFAAEYRSVYGTPPSRTLRG